MTKNKLTTAVLILLLAVIALWMIANYAVTGKSTKKMDKSDQAPVSSYNLPKEIKYDSSTDLKKELDSINPEVIDSDFSTLN